MYADKPEFVAALEDFVRGRPPQPVDAFLHQSEAVLAHDAEAQLGRIVAPPRSPTAAGTGSPRPLGPNPHRRHQGLRASGLRAHLSHAGLPEDAEGFNQATLEFLTRQKL